MSAEKTDELASRHLSALNTHDPDAIAALFAAESIVEMPSLPGGRATGPAAVRAYYVTLFRAFPDLVAEELDRLESTDGAVAVLAKITGTHRGPLDPPGFAPTNGRGGVQCMSHTRTRDGKITEFRLIYDQLDLGRQIGAIPPSGSRAERVVVLLQRAKAAAMRRRNR